MSATYRQQLARQEHISRELDKLELLKGAPRCPECGGKPDEAYRTALRCRECGAWYNREEAKP